MSLLLFLSHEVSFVSEGVFPVRMTVFPRRLPTLRSRKALDDFGEPSRSPTLQVPGQESDAAVQYLLVLLLPGMGETVPRVVQGHKLVFHPCLF